MTSIESNGVGAFRVFKFENKGDTLEAVLKGVEDKDWLDESTGKVKTISNVIFDEAGEVVKVPGYKGLVDAVRENPQLMGKKIIVEYKKDVPTSLGNPKKVFKIDF